MRTGRQAAASDRPRHAGNNSRSSGKEHSAETDATAQGEEWHAGKGPH